MSLIVKAAEALRQDPLFAVLGEDAQWEAARAQLAVEGSETFDPLDVGTVVQLARIVKRPPGGPRGAAPKPPKPPPAPKPPRPPAAPRETLKAGTYTPNLLAKMVMAAPYSQSTLAHCLGVSRQLIGFYLNGAVAERLMPSDAASLAKLCRGTIAGLQEVLPELDRISIS